MQDKPEQQTISSCSIRPIQPPPATVLQAQEPKVFTHYQKNKIHEIVKAWNLPREEIEKFEIEMIDTLNFNQVKQKLVLVQKLLLFYVEWKREFNDMTVSDRLQILSLPFQCFERLFFIIRIGYKVNNISIRELLNLPTEKFKKFFPQIRIWAAKNLECEQLELKRIQQQQQQQQQQNKYYQSSVISTDTNHVNSQQQFFQQQFYQGQLQQDVVQIQQQQQIQQFFQQNNQLHTPNVSSGSQMEANNYTCQHQQQQELQLQQQQMDNLLEIDNVCDGDNSKHEDQYHHEKQINNQFEIQSHNQQQKKQCCNRNLVDQSQKLNRYRSCSIQVTQSDKFVEGEQSKNLSNSQNLRKKQNISQVDDNQKNNSMSTSDQQEVASQDQIQIQIQNKNQNQQQLELNNGVLQQQQQKQFQVNSDDENFFNSRQVLKEISVEQIIYGKKSSQIVKPLHKVQISQQSEQIQTDSNISFQGVEWRRGNPNKRVKIYVNEQISQGQNLSEQCHRF